MRWTECVAWMWGLRNAYRLRYLLLYGTIPISESIVFIYLVTCSQLRGLCQTQNMDKQLIIINCVTQSVRDII
jgi:hypothetical protein